MTNAQYERFLKAKGRKPPTHWGDRRFNQADQPVVGVSWYDAQAYAAWAKLELPSEARWEAACRAGTTTRFWSGNELEGLMRVGWCSENSEARLHAVGEKPANPWGLYDMHGNVLEWCVDGWSRPYVGV